MFEAYPHSTKFAARECTVFVLFVRFSKDWSSVNNSTEDQKMNGLRSPEEGMTEDQGEEITDFDSITDSQRRRLWRRLWETTPSYPKNAPYMR